jgi:hypothetical protein
MLKKLNTHGIKRFLSQVDTTTRIPDKNVSFIVRSLDPEVHFKDPDAIRRVRIARQKTISKPFVAKLADKMPTTGKKVLLDDINLQEEKKRQMDDQIKKFRHDFVLVQPVIKAIMDKPEIYNSIDKNVVEGFKKFLKEQSA